MALGHYSRAGQGLYAKDKMLLDGLAHGLYEADIARVMGVVKEAVHSRNVRLKQFSGTHSAPEMVYWALDNYHISPLTVTHDLSKLTEKQLEAGELICRGMTDDQIARKLHIARPTVMSRVKKLLDVTGAYNRANLVGILCSAELVV